MFEYASVSASAYDVDSLVSKLNAHASQGWEVTSVVAAGGDVVAIMQRTRSGAFATTSSDVDTHAAAAEVPAMAEVAVAEAAPAVAEVTAPAVEAAYSPMAEGASSAHDTAGSFVDQAKESDLDGIGAGIAGAAAGVGVGSIFGHDTSAAHEAAADISVPNVDVPQVEMPHVEVPQVNVPAVDVATPYIDTPAVDVMPTIDPMPTVDPSPASEPTGWGSAQTSVGTPVAQAPVAVPAPAPVVTTPAGWYPDPSTRFEMRYWDGNAWTEHVSRQGQQFTDPPVA